MKAIIYKNDDTGSFFIYATFKDNKHETKKAFRVNSEIKDFHSLDVAKVFQRKLNKGEIQISITSKHFASIANNLMQP